MLAGVALLTLGACDRNRERDPVGIKIDRSYALPIGSDPMGGQVPDRCRVYIEASEVGVHRVRLGDSFRASLNVGTSANISKYGGVSGLRFTIVGDIGTSQQFNYTAYRAESEPVEISCDAQNKLRFTISGESVDKLELRVKTAGQPNQTLVRQNGHPGAMSHGWNPSGSDYSYQYSCLVERQP
jgi:hypothetical protein